VTEAELEQRCREASEVVSDADMLASKARKARTKLWRRARASEHPPSFSKLAAWSGVTQNAVIKACEAKRS
jgi:hypothetical protein